MFTGDGQEGLLNIWEEGDRENNIQGLPWEVQQYSMLRFDGGGHYGKEDQNVLVISFELRVVSFLLNVAKTSPGFQLQDRLPEALLLQRLPSAMMCVPDIVIGWNGGKISAKRAAAMPITLSRASIVMEGRFGWMLAQSSPWNMRSATRLVTCSLKCC